VQIQDTIAILWRNAISIYTGKILYPVDFKYLIYMRIAAERKEQVGVYRFIKAVSIGGFYRISFIFPGIQTAFQSVGTIEIVFV